MSGRKGMRYQLDKKSEFMKRVDIMSYGCWKWLGTRDTANRDFRGYEAQYGLFWNGKKQVRAHRYSYELHKGKIPEGLVVMHSCNTSLCVNPSHLSLGTPTWNIKDRWAQYNNRVELVWKGLDLQDIET